MYASIWYYPRLLLCILLACVGSKFSFAQHARTTEYEFRGISMQDGLANQIVTTICEDNRGMLWFGTYNGLYRFDGFRVRRFSDKTNGFLPTEYITDVEYLSTSGSAGHLLVCTSGKGWLVDVAKDQIVPFETVGFPQNIFKKCTQIERKEDNTYWVIADSALYRMVRTDSNQYSIDTLGAAPGAPTTKIVALPCGSEGIWLLPAAQEAYHVSASGIYSRYTLPEFLNNPTPITGLLGLIQTPLGLIGWDCVRNLYRLNPMSGTFEPERHQMLSDFFPTLAALDRYYKQRNILRLQYTLSTGQEAIGTTLGLFIFQKRSNQFRVPEGMIGSEIRGILTDSIGNWWAGTYTGFFRGNLTREGINRVSSIQGVWGGIPLDSATWMLICENKAGVFVLNKHQNNVRKPALSVPMKHVPASALSICRDLTRNIWVGTYTNLYRSPPEAPFDFHPVTYPGTSKPVEASFFRALLTDRDSSIWAGAENGLFRLRYNQSPEHCSLDTVLPDVFISDLYADRFDNIWIATKGKGLAKYNRAENSFVWFDTERGLANNSTCRIEAGNDDRVLWISTHDGLSRLDVQTGIVHNYHEEDGIPGNEFNSAASARAPNGMLLFGGVAGLVHFHPDSLQPPNFRYKTILSFVHVYSTGADSADVRHVPDSVLQLPPYPRLVEVCVGVNDFVQSSQTRFRYRIAGVISEWVYTDGESKIRLFNLAPGYYTLEVQAMPFDGHFGESARLNIAVEQPYYETWWFRAMLLAVLFLLAYLAYRNRLRQALRTYAIRQQIADDLHDDIGNRLNITNILLQKIKREFLDKQVFPDPEIWAGLQEANQHTLQSLRTLIWSVDPHKDRLENLIARMQDFADDYLEPLNIRSRFILPEPVPEGEISLDCRHNAITIFQELLTNMVKHAHPKYISVQLALSDENTLLLTMTNTFGKAGDGHFNVSSDNRGMSSVNRRLQKIGATIKKTETTDTDQTIVLSFPKLFAIS